ncbi:MAG: methylmalonyl-CoA mutase family protein [Bacteroidia bacterium]|nr:methylmalonyl-CoA mutase family protein [Bacteroidia bacterium]
MSLPLFPEFPPVSSEEWRKQAEAALKGKNIESLRFSPEPGLNLAPWYRAEDLQSIAHELTLLPGKFPFRRGNRFHAHGPGWQLTQEISADQPGALQRLGEALPENPDAIALTGYYRLPEVKELEPLLARFPFPTTALHLEVNQRPVLTVLELVKILRVRKMKNDLLTGTLYNDPISTAAAAGKAVHPVEMAHCEGGIINGRNLPHFRTLGLDFSWVQEMGGTITDEIAFALAAITDYLDFFEETKSVLTRKEILENVAFTFSIGSDFFMETAKLRVFRILYAQLIAAWGETRADLQSPFLLSRTSRQNLSLYDSHNNLLRGTTAALSAIIGGTNALIVTAFDRMKGPETAQSARLSRNIQHLLRHESYLDKVTDPGGGSWYLEVLTEQLAENAWSRFQKIEKLGGFTRMMKEGQILQLLEHSAENKDTDLSTRKSVMVGVNHYPNPSEMLSEVKAHELLSPYETLRLETDKQTAKNGKRPIVFLFGFGDVKMGNARKQFARDLLSCLGLEIVEEGSLAPLQPRIAVLCSSDADYKTTGKTILAQAREQAPRALIVVAGHPEKVEITGADEYIYFGMNALTFLQKIAARL